MRRAIVAVAAAAAGYAGEARAGACPSPHLTVLPSGAAPVPTNVELRVVFDASTVEAIELVDEQTRQIKASGAVEAATAEVVIRDGAGAIVPSATRRTPDTLHPGFIVKPASALAAATAYAVVVRAGAKEYVVSRFTTGTGPDDDPPALDAVGKPRFYRWRGSSPPHWKDPRGTFAELTTGVTGAIGFEIHAGAPATLRTVVGAGPAIRFGATDACTGPDFAFPRAKTMKLWVRAFDAAGNLSPLRAVTLDLRRPRAR